MRKLLLLAGLSVVLAGPLAVETFARAGGGHSYSGGGHSHSGGYHSHSSYSGGSYRRGGDDFLFQLILLGFQRNPMGMLLLIGVILFVYYQVQTQMQVGYGAFVDGTIRRGLERQGQEAVLTGMSALKERDPAFDSAAFLARARIAFLKIQKGWSDQNLAEARAFATDGVIERFTVQLALSGAQGIKNVMSDVQVLENEIVQLECNAIFDAIHVRIQASATDRDYSTADGSIARDGSGTFEEIWTFLRRRSAKSATRGGFEGFCPNCGAPLQLADAAQCASCKSWVNSGEFDWVLSKITQTCEWGVREPDRDIPGWPAFAQKDPAACAEFLEDRASLAFWRMQQAYHRGQASGLRGTATDDFCARMAAALGGKPRVFSNPAVGTVVLLALEEAQPLDRAHLMVRWSADGAVMQDVFVLGRKHGQATDARAGLRSSRCPSCGAPPSRGDEPKCEYCAAVFNDGSKHWVLVDVVPGASWTTPPSIAARGAQSGDAPDWAAALAPRDALAVLAVGMKADGKISPEEQAFLESFGLKKRVPPAMIRQIVAAADAGRLVAPQPASRGEAGAILRGLVEMSLADGRIEDGERQIMQRYGLAAGYTSDDVDRLVEAERQRLYTKAKEGLISGR